MSITNNAVRVLARVLGSTPRPIRSQTAVDDRIVQLEVAMHGGQQIKLDAIWAGDGRPAEVRRVLDSLPESWPRSLILTARRLSPGAIEVLQERDANWADETGHARISTSDLIVLRDSSLAEEARIRFAWSPSALAIAEVILARDWGEGIRTAELARVAGWSPAQVSEVLQAFDGQGWTEKFGPQRGPGARRELVDAEGLLDAWSIEMMTSAYPRRFGHRLGRDLEEFFTSTLAPQLDQRVRWAATGWLGAELLAPFATHLPALQIYIADEDFFETLSDVMRNAGLSEVPEAGRVEFISVPAEVLARGNTGGPVPVASVSRVYVDLLRLGGRAEDVAEHLREEAISSLHHPFSVREVGVPLQEWELGTRKRAIAKSESAGRPGLYSRGVWTASYRLETSSAAPRLRRLLELLRENVGHETGWPMWNARIGSPKVAGGAVECWLAEGSVLDAGSADYWRVSPDGFFSLLRGYQEDGEIPEVPPGERLDLTLPIWRTGEALLHAARMASAFGAHRVEFMMRWDGLRGRQLTTVVDRRRVMFEQRRTDERVVVSALQTRADVIQDRLPELVRHLVEPLYEVFDFFDPPSEIYVQELDRMRQPV